MTDIQHDAIPAKPQNAPGPPRNPWKTATVCLAAALTATSGGLVYTLVSDQGAAAPEASASIREDTRTPATPMEMYPLPRRLRRPLLQAPRSAPRPAAAART